MYFVEVSDNRSRVYRLDDSGDRIYVTPFILGVKNSQAICDFYNALYDFSKSIIGG